MKKALFLLAVTLAGTAVFLGLAGCEALTNGNTPGTGVLTINGLPGGSSWVVTVLNYQDTIDSQAELTTINTAGYTIAATVGAVSSSPVSLYTPAGGSNFSQTGVFAVVLASNNPVQVLLKSKISFTNGSAAINYSDLVNYATLPPVEDDDGGEEGGEDPVSSGTLTINGLTGGLWTVTVLNYQDTIDSQAELAAAQANTTAAGLALSSPVTLYTTSAGTFSQTGIFAVVLASNNPAKVLLKSQVSFTNGSAAINYSDLVDSSTLPSVGEEGGEDPVSSGTLTINGLTGGPWAVTVLNYQDTIDSQMELATAQMNTIAASAGLASSSPVTLYTTSAGAFSQTGVFAVVLASTNPAAIKVIHQISFTNGSAAINYSDLVDSSTLPLTDGGEEGGEDNDDDGPVVVDPDIEVPEGGKVIHITTQAELAAINAHIDDQDKNYGKNAYILDNDITLTGTWTPIGDVSSVGQYGAPAGTLRPFSGTFYGNGHTIHNVVLPGGDVCYNGLFGFTRNALIRDLQVELGENNLTITAAAYGRNSYSVGGLVGADDSRSNTRIINCGVYSPYTLTVTSTSSHYNILVSGIMGFANRDESTASIANSYAALNIAVTKNGTHVTASGIAYSIGSVENSYFIGTINANCGYVWLSGIGSDSIQNSYSAGNLSSTNTGAAYSSTGGISLSGNISISNSAVLLNSITHTNNSNYARIQRNSSSSSVADFSNNYAYSGMLLNGSTVSGTADSQNGLDKTAAELKTQSTYETGLGWDFTGVWEMGPAQYPFPILKWQNGQVHIPAGFEVIEDASTLPPPDEEEDEENQWAKTISAGSGRSYFFDIVVDSQGNTYAAGAQEGNGSYNYGNGVSFTGPAGSTYRNAVLVKYDPQGNALWARGALSGSNASTFGEIAVDSSGNVYVVGELVGTGLSYNFGLGSVTTKASSGTGIIVKYASDGTPLLQKTPESASGSYANFGDIGLDSQGNVFVSGFKYGNVNYGNGVTANYGDAKTSSLDTGVLVKYDSTLTAQWARTPANTSALNCIGRIAIDSTGAIYGVGYTNGGSITFGDLPSISGSGSTYNSLIVKWDNSGNALWAKTVSSGTNSGFNAITVYGSAVYAAGYQTGTGTYNYGGVTVTASGSGKNPALVKYDAATGAALWGGTAVSGGSAGEFHDAAADETGIYAVGYQTGTSAYHYGNSVSVQGASTAKNSVLVRYNTDGTALDAQSVSAGTSDSEFRAVFLQGNSVYTAGTQKGTGTYTYAAGSLTGTSATENAVIMRYSE